MHFRLIGQATIFRAVHRYNALGGTLPCVVGRTLDGRWQTVARVEDVDLVPDSEVDAARATHALRPPRARYTSPLPAFDRADFYLYNG